MKKILIIWTIIAVILVGGLTYIGFNIKKQNKPYTDLEINLEKLAVSLVGEKPSIINETNKLTIEDFENNSYEINMNVGNDKCDGYVIVEKKLSFYKYSAYISCNNYVTNGYNK